MNEENAYVWNTIDLLTDQQIDRIKHLTSIYLSNEVGKITDRARLNQYFYAAKAAGIADSLICFTASELADVAASFTTGDNT